MSNFQVLSTDSSSSARCGLLNTPHGPVQTPVFMPVGTAGAVKGITPAQLKNTGTSIILANTYHLMLRPGVQVIESLGGLHRFIGWNGPILTDSGGYQLFSLSQLAQIKDAGVVFASHIDGASTYLDAEMATEIQHRLGADIIMCLDQCPPYPSEPDKLHKAVQRTIAWARRCKHAHKPTGPLLFAIVQGGTDPQLRAHCAQELVKLDFDGYAIGGLGLGEGHDQMIETVRRTAEFLPPQKPRYLMGLGTPADIIAAVAAGIDMFDCVLPTRNGRNASAFTKAGPIRLRNNAYINDPEPVEPGCQCYCCRNFSRAAIRHFFNVGEMLGPILLSIHNLTFYNRLISQISQKIQANSFAHWAEHQLKNQH